MIAQAEPRARPATFTRREWRALCELRSHYQEDRDLFTAQERARLLFIRWLYRTGRISQ